MKIYTRTGDAGQTGLYGGARVSKDDARVEAYGSVDELNAALGMVRATPLATEVDGVVHRAQRELFVLGAELACLPEKIAALELGLIDDACISALEQDIDGAEAGLEPLRNFVLPAGTPAAAALHLARTICRRAERTLVGAARDFPIRPVLIVYLNRLSDLLFVLARRANMLEGVPDEPWQPRPRST